MKALLLFPEYPATFWSFKYALRFISKKASFPPLGLLTVAAMLPEDWQVRLVDMNVQKLSDSDIEWADIVFASGMIIQADSAKKALGRCKELGKTVVAGGPLFNGCGDEFDGLVDHFVLNEAEVTLQGFLRDLEASRPAATYASNEWGDLTSSPVPRRDLVNMDHYAAMNIQYSRGCPFDCEFCNITTLFGRVPRTKTAEQMLAELDNIHALGWRGGVFIVDDNFIGNKSKLKRELLPAMIGWMEKHEHPFTFITEVSINLADDPELMELMVNAGFDTVFVGIESPNEGSLAECDKRANKGRNMVESIHAMQRAGLEVQGGFIVGFDNDPPEIFDRMVEFIQESWVGTAMVGLLTALPNTKLYDRMMREGRLIERTSGDNLDLKMNFLPAMNYDMLSDGYKKLLERIYSPKNYYARVRNFLKNYPTDRNKHVKLRYSYVMALPKSIVRLGILGRERIQYWRLFFWTLFRRPKLFPYAITLSIYGFHFRKMVRNMRSVKS